MNAKPESCKGCPLYHESMVWGEGPPSAKLVFIGQNPGPEEVKVGRPFVGGAGNILDRAIRRVGGNRSGTFVTNAVKCFVKPRTPVPARAVAKCKPLLEKELRCLPNATTICTLGQEAFSSITPGLKLSLVHDRRASKGNPSYRIRGCPDTVPVFGRDWTLVPTFHPIFLAYSGFALSNEFEADLARAFRFARGEAVLVHRDIDPAPSPKVIRDTVCEILECGEGGVDIETPLPSELEEDDIETRRFLPVLDIGLCPGSAKYAISAKPGSFEHVRPLFDLSARDGLPSDLRESRPVLWAHGSSFDFHHLSSLFPLRGVREADSMQLFHLLQSDSRKKDIVAMCSMYTDLPFWKWMHGVNDDLYNAYDTWGTLIGGQNMMREVRRLDLVIKDRFPWAQRTLEWLFWNHQMPATQITREWEFHGAAYDQDKSDELECYIRLVVEQYEQQWNAVFPFSNWRSPKQLVELFTVLGERIPLKKRAKKDKESGAIVAYKSPSVDDAVLAGFARKGNETAKLVQLLREYSKAADFLGKANKDPERGSLGRIYFRAKPHGQAGGRIQTVKENMQQIPEDICSPGPGQPGINPRLTIISDNVLEDVILQADFGQIEFWVYSWYAKCRRALELKESNTYLYGGFYEDIWGEPFFKQGLPREKANRDKARTPAWKLLVAKSWPLGFIYGRGVPDPEEQGLPIDRAAAKRIHDKFHRDYPEYRVLHTDLELKASRYGYLQTVFARLRRFPNPKQDRNEILAFPGQSTAVDILIRNALLPLSRELPRLFGERSRILFTVHDSAICNVTIADTSSRPTLSRAIDAYDLVKSSMEQPIAEMDGFTIPAEVQLGKSWGSGKPIEDFSLEFDHEFAGA